MTKLSELGSTTALAVYRTMARIHAADEKIQQGLAAGHLQFQYYPAGGQEAISATIGQLFKEGDQFVTTYRVIHDIVAKGSSMREIMAEMYGKASGTSSGKGGPMHLSDPANGLVLTTGIVGAGAPIANGIALAAQMKGTNTVAVCSFGDGAANIGAVHEALNLAALWQLPVVFLCQNNLYAEYTSFAESTRSQTIAERAAAYGMAGIRCDGCDPVEIYSAAETAIQQARCGDGPTLLECVAPRLQGHAFGSDKKHMDLEKLQTDIANAPMVTVRQRLIDEGIADESQLKKIDDDAQAEVDEAVDFAISSDEPDASELYTDIFVNAGHLPEGPGSQKVTEPDPEIKNPIQTTFGQAVNDALDVALSSDPDVVLLGEDIMDPAGGIVKATAGLSTKHGLDRVRGTPISEQAIVGAAVGAAIAGMKPVAEIMVCDFAMVCMDQIANHAAKLRYMSGGRTGVPATIRMLTAGNVGSFGAQHSQSLESWFAHIPGLKVVAPSTAFDAKGLLLSCIHDPDPCISLEAMRCFFAPGEIEEGDYRIPLGKAAKRKTGNDITIVGYSWAMQEIEAATTELEAQGVSCEVIDLRSLIPLDKDTVFESVAKTGRVLVVHPAVEFCGFGAELSAQIHQTLFQQLKAPVARLGARYTPIPFNKGLEAMHFPDAKNITTMVEKILAT